MTEQDQKYLADKMGIKYIEKHKLFSALRLGLLATWDSPTFFMFCFNWAKQQEWWDEFLDQFHQQREAIYFCFPIHLIGSKFAPKLVEFLKSRE
jgi:hypothetical protein